MVTGASPAQAIGQEISAVRPATLRSIQLRRAHGILTWGFSQTTRPFSVPPFRGLLVLFTVFRSDQMLGRVILEI
jgi:hypothetical protein